MVFKPCEYAARTWRLLHGATLLPEVIAGVTFINGEQAERRPPPESQPSTTFHNSSARSSDGLPDSADILFEQSFLNTSCLWTGRIIGGGTRAHEYVFDATLTNPIHFMAGMRYWMEVVQVGDVNRLFRWEVSQAADRFAYLNPDVPYWQLVAFNANRAFQISMVPEPCASTLIVIGTSIAAAVRRKGG